MSKLKALNKSIQSVGADLYEAEYYAKGFQTYDHPLAFKNNPEKMIQPSIRKAFELFNPENKKILDIGCGLGGLEFLCLKNKNQVTALDFSKTAVNMAKKLLGQFFSEKKKKQAGFIVSDCVKAGYKANYYDYVYMLDVLEHITDKQIKELFKKLYKAIKQDGKIIIHTSPNKLVSKPLYFFAGLMGYSIHNNKFHINEQSIFSVKKYFKENFKIKRWIEREKYYVYNQLKTGNLTKNKIIIGLAYLFDLIFDNPLSYFIITHTPLVKLFGTDIWIILEKK